LHCGRDRYDVESRLRKQELFLGRGELCVVGSNSLACGHERQNSSDAGDAW